MKFLGLLAFLAFSISNLDASIRDIKKLNQQQEALVYKYATKFINEGPSDIQEVAKATHLLQELIDRHTSIVYRYNNKNSIQNITPVNHKEETPQEHYDHAKNELIEVARNLGYAAGILEVCPPAAALPIYEAATHFLEACKEYNTAKEIERKSHD